jgi:hypothetical protein
LHQCDVPDIGPRPDFGVANDAEESTMNTTTARSVSLALALALPAGAWANGQQGGSSPAPRGAAIGSMQDRMEYGTGARGGGPERGAVSATPQTARATIVHDDSARIVTVRSTLDAARVLSDGLGRLAGLEPGAMDAVYQAHTRALVDSIRRDVELANRHMDDLRGTIPQIAPQPSVGNDLTSAGDSLQRARTQLAQLEGAGQGVQSQQVRDVSRSLSRELTAANAAMSRVERGLR